MKFPNRLMLHKSVYFNCYIYILWGLCNGLFLYLKMDLVKVPKLLVVTAYLTMISTFGIKLFLVYSRQFISDISKLTWIFLLTILIQMPIVSFFLISLSLLLCTPVEVCLHSLLLLVTLLESTTSFLTVWEAVKLASNQCPSYPQYFSTTDIRPISHVHVNEATRSEEFLRP